jgi:hypothetical protein
MLCDFAKLEKGLTAMCDRLKRYFAPVKVAFAVTFLGASVVLYSMAVAQAPAGNDSAVIYPGYGYIYPGIPDYRCTGSGTRQLFPGTPTITAGWLSRGWVGVLLGARPGMGYGTVYQPFVSGPPVGTVVYPYYTVRGPRDFLAKDPPSIGP